MKNVRRTLVLAAALFVYDASTSQAQDGWGRLFPSLFLTSDYRYDGMSLADHKPTAQASLYWWRPDKFYAGVWLSGVDFSDLGDTTTSYEVDVYGGRNFDFRRVQLTIEGMYSIFPDKDVPGPTYNFATAKVRLRRSIRRLTIGSGIAWIPDGPYDAGPGERLIGEASYTWTKWFTTNGQIGHRWNARGMDRTFWDIGAKTTWRNVSVDVRYSDTDLTYSECGFVTWCEAGIAATLQIDLWH